MQVLSDGSMMSIHSRKKTENGVFPHTGEDQVDNWRFESFDS